MQARYGAQALETEGGVPQADDLMVGGVGAPLAIGADARLGAANGSRVVHQWDVALVSGMRVLFMLGE